MYVDVYKGPEGYTGKEKHCLSLGAEIMGNFPSLCFLVFSKMFSINMYYFYNGEKSTEYYLRNKKLTRYCVYWVLVVCQPTNFLMFYFM